jgi:hypothetical protein
MWSWIACYVNGHDYSVSCESGSMFLRCVHCGRRSQGWTVHSHGAQAHRESDAAGNTVAAVGTVTAINANA